MKVRLISLVLLLCIAVTQVLSAIPAQAAPTVPTITVSVKAPVNWTEVYLYLADSNSNCYHYEWPGAQMVMGADGWWTIELPYGYTTVVANNGSGGEQTMDLKMDGYTDAWITIIDYTDSTGLPHDAVVSCPDADEARNDANKPLDNLSIVGTGIPGVKEWDPADPNGNMNKISDTVYSRIFSFHAGDRMLFKFVGNNYWNSEYNFGSLADGHPYTSGAINFLTCGGGSRYYSYTVDHDCNLRITADLSPVGHGANPILKIEETYDDPDSPAGMPPVEYVSVFAKVPEDWTDVRIWAWNKQSEPVNPDPWPGTMMMTHISNGWHTARLPGWFTSVLIVGNGGSIYTQEIIVEPGRDIWINAYMDYQNPIFTYGRLDIPCSHKNHTPSGLCVLCRVNVPHDYDINFHCPCGADATDFTTVYFDKTDEFSDVYALWSNSSPSSGILETGIQMVVDENGIYSCQFPKGMNYLVFHDSDGTRCVANSGNMTEENVVFRGSDKSWVTYEEAITLKETEQLENNHLLTVILICAGILTFLVAGITTVILLKKKMR